MNNEEVRALETERDYQNEIDKLEKEIAKQIKLRDDCNKTIKANEKVKERAEKELKDLIDDNADQSKINKKRKEIEQFEDNINNLSNMYNKARQEITKLVDKQDDLKAEAKKKGFRVRSEELDFEERALKTEKDYQKAIDKAADKWHDLEDKYKKEFQDWKKIKGTPEGKELLKQMSKTAKERDNAKDEMNDLINEALGKGFDVRYETTDFEARKAAAINNLTNFHERKQEVLEKLEERALETLGDYEKALDKLGNKWKKNHELLMDAYKKEQHWSNLADNYEKEEKSINDDMRDLVNQAKKAGFELNQQAFRSEELDFEYRAIQTKDDYVKEAKPYFKELNEADRMMTPLYGAIDDCKENIEELNQELKDAKKKGDKERIAQIERDIKIYEDRIDNFEVKLEKWKKQYLKAKAKIEALRKEAVKNGLKYSELL